jgi:hypothetical protein
MATEEIKLRLTYETNARPAEQASARLKRTISGMQSPLLKAGKVAAKGTKEYKAQVQHQIKIAKALHKIRGEEQKRLEVLKKQRREMRSRVMTAPMRGLGRGVRGLTSMPGLIGMYAGGRAARFGWDKFIGENVALEQAKARFRGLLHDVDPSERRSAWKETKEQADKYGFSRKEWLSASTGMLPYVKGPEQYRRVRGLMAQTAIARSDLAFDDIRFAFKEALSGDFLSLQERLDVPKSLVRNMKKQGKTNEEILTAALGQVGVSPQVVAEMRKTLGFQLKTSRNMIDNLLASVGEKAFERLSTLNKGQSFSERLNAIISSRKFQQFLDSAGDALGRLVDWLTQILSKLPAAFSWMQDHWDMIKTVTVGLGGMMIISKVTGMLGRFGGKLGGVVGSLALLGTAAQAAADWMDAKHKKEIGKEGWEESLKYHRQRYDRMVAEGKITPAVAATRMSERLKEARRAGVGETGWLPDLMGTERYEQLALEKYGRGFTEATMGEGGRQLVAHVPGGKPVVVNIDVKADTAQSIVDQVTGGLLTSLNRLFDAEARAQ